MGVNMTDDIRSRLDLGHIRAAAHWAAQQLVQRSVAQVHLTPGDMTVYRIVLCATEVWSDGDGDDVWRGVAAVVRGGDSYPWTGAKVHVSYVGAKWTRGNIASAVVVEEFLNSIAALLGRQLGQQ